MNWSNRLAPFFVTLFLVVISNSSAFAQCDPPFGTVRNNEGSSRIDVQLNFPITDDELVIGPGQINGCLSMYPVPAWSGHCGL